MSVHCKMVINSIIIQTWIRCVLSIVRVSPLPSGAAPHFKTSSAGPDCTGIMCDFSFILHSTNLYIVRDRVLKIYFIPQNHKSRLFVSFGPIFRQKVEICHRFDSAHVSLTALANFVIILQIQIFHPFPNLIRLTSTNIWVALVCLTEFCSPSVGNCVWPVALDNIFCQERDSRSHVHWTCPVTRFGRILITLCICNVFVVHFLNNKSPGGTELKQLYKGTVVCWQVVFSFLWELVDCLILKLNIIKNVRGLKLYSTISYPDLVHKSSFSLALINEYA